jgi:hypothetical protein
MIRINDLVHVSNNSMLTNKVFRTLDEKLNDQEKRDFFEWLKLVKQNQQIKSNRFKHNNFY